MKSIGYLLYLIIAFGGTFLFVARRSGTRHPGVTEVHKNYLSTTGRIISRQQRIGLKTGVLTAYTISYTARDGNEYTQTGNTSLGNSYNPGDMITIFYYPLNPYDPVMDQTGMDAMSKPVNYNTVLFCSLGALILAAIFFYRRK